METQHINGPYWAHQEIDDPLSTLARNANRALLELIEACCPDGDFDVEDHAAKLSIRLGLSRSRAIRLCEAGLMFKRMPRLAKMARETAVLNEPAINIISNGTYAIRDEQIHHVESDILKLLEPQKRRQAMIGPRKLNSQIGDIVATFDDAARGDGTIPNVKVCESLTCVEVGDNIHAQLTAVLRKDRAREVMAAIEATWNAEKANHAKKKPEEKDTKSAADFTLPDAFVGLIKAQTKAEIVLNLYRTPGSNEAWLDGVGWLNGMVTEEWMNQTTHLRVSADSTTNGYQPSAAQVARVRGRDGTCRYPGCEVPAYKCDLDHIQPFDESGPTDTENLHCLCRRHHNLKTNRLWNITAYSDGSELWSSIDGTTATSVPSGPLAGFGRQTFEQRMTRKTKLRNQQYMDFLMSFNESETVIGVEEPTPEELEPQGTKPQLAK